MTKINIINKTDWVTIIQLWIDLTKGDFDLSCLVVQPVYFKITHELTPYPKKTIIKKISVCIVLSKKINWRVSSKANIKSIIVVIEVVMIKFLVSGNLPILSNNELEVSDCSN